MALIIGLNRAFVGHAGAVLPDIPFAALALALFEGLAAGISVPVLAAGTAFACLLRPHGVALAAALAWGLGRNRGPAFLAAALLPWGLWTAMAGGSPAAHSFAGLWSAQASPDIGRLATHAAEALSRLTGQGCFGSPWPGAAGAAWGLGGLALAGAGMRNGETWLKAAGSFAALVLAMHLSWGPVFLRYALPIAPLLLLPAFKAASSRLSRPVLAALALGAFLQTAPLAWSGLRAPAREPQPRTMAWLRENAPPGSRIQSIMPFSIALWTGLETRFPSPAGSEGEWAEGLRRGGITHVHGFGAGRINHPFPGGGLAPEFLTTILPERREFERLFSDAAEGSQSSIKPVLDQFYNPGTARRFNLTGMSENLLNSRSLISGTMTF